MGANVLLRIDAFYLISPAKPTSAVVGFNHQPV
jgi:hypothetical protein